jgi:ribose transport system substrate-binding protein
MYKGANEAFAGTDLMMQGAGGPVVTNYNPQEAEQAMGGLLSQHGSIVAVLGDYGLVAQAAMNAFTSANQPLPALAIASGQNSVYCGWWKNKDAGNEQAFAEWGGATQIARAALRRGLAAFNGITWDEPRQINLPKVIDTAAGVLPPECRTDLPDDTDMFSNLTEAELKDAIG